MPRIYVEFAGMKQIENGCKAISSAVDNIQYEFQHTVNQLDWDIKFQSNINSTALQIAKKIEAYSRALSQYKNFVDDTYSKYDKLNNEKIAPLISSYSSENTTGLPGTMWDNLWSDYISGWFRDVLITKPYILSAILSLISPAISSLILNSGVLVNSHGSANVSAGWLGYKFDDDHPGITAWLGKASAAVQNDWSYAGVNAYLGKAETEAKTAASFMKSKTKREYKSGEWTEKEQLSFLNAEASAGVSVATLAGDTKAGIGDDMLGLEGKAEGTVGSARAKAKGQLSVGEDRVNAYVKGEAIVAAVEGKASGTINILGIEITGEVGGYAGAAGVEGKIGIENEKFVIKGGIAALIGGSAGIEIGFNEEGWDNFIDFITFWD